MNRERRSPYTPVGGSRGFRRSAGDFYATAPALTHGLLEVERFARTIAEPACGDGAISRILVRRGHKVVSTDIRHRGYGQGGIDFLRQWIPAGEDLITNPPFRLWFQFAEHALRGFAPAFRKVALLGRLQLLEGKKISRLFAETRLARVWVSAGRVNMLPPGAIDKGHNTMNAWAWFVWERGWTGRPELGWFTPGAA